MSTSLDRATAPTEYLAQERSIQTNCLDEARGLCDSDFHYSRKEIVAKQLIMEDDLSLRFDGSRYRLTEKALDELCGILGIPAQFAHDIPTELLPIIVAHLRGLHEQVIAVIYRDDVVVGVLDPQKWCKARSKTRRPHYRPPTMREVLDLLASLCSRGAGHSDETHISLSDAGLRAQLLSPSLTVEPQVGDLIRVGLILTASETGGPLPVARGHTHRLVCRNGATMPDHFGLVRFSSDWRVNYDHRMAAFAAGMRAFSPDGSHMRAAFSNLVDAVVPDLTFYHLHRQVRFVYRHVEHSNDRADRAIGVERDQRQTIIGRVRQRQADIRHGTRTVYSRSLPTDLHSYDVFNSLTATAREEPHKRRVELERLAGTLLDRQLLGRGYLPNEN